MHLPQPHLYCVRCRFHREICLCSEARRVGTELRVFIILHAVETFKLSNTGHLAHLVMPNCQLAVHGRRRGPPADLSELRNSDPDHPVKTILLHPGLGARELTGDYVQELRAPNADGIPMRLRLVVPDGTWSQARRMVKRLPELAHLPRVMLPAVPASVARAAMRPRTNPDAAERVSTCEAIASAVGLLGEDAAEAALYAVYDAAALRVALLRGKIALTDHRSLLRPETPQSEGVVEHLFIQHER